VPTNLAVAAFLQQAPLKRPWHAFGALAIRDSHATKVQRTAAARIRAAAECVSRKRWLL